jgi:hypothetical protein
MYMWGNVPKSRYYAYRCRRPLSVTNTTRLASSRIECRFLDVSGAEALHGLLIRGIPWIRLMAREGLQRRKAHLSVYWALTNAIEGDGIKLALLGVKQYRKRFRGKEGGLNRDDTRRGRVTF